MSDVLTCTGLSKSFHDAGVSLEVLQAIDLSVGEGEQIALMGASGSGKSTLLHILGGLDLPTGGQVSIDGTRIDQLNAAELGRLRNRALGFVYQFHHLLPEFTALENVAMPLLMRGQSPARASEAASDMLARVGLAGRAVHKPGEMSGGERQRAAVARALVTRPRCVLADEPTGNLDRQNAEQVYQLMLELNREFGTSFIVATHDPQIARRMDRIYMLEDGRLVPQEAESSHTTD
jgi:lipoprotein-releasing system ATP-binding protein